MLDEKSAKEIAKISLSNGTVVQHIEDLAANIKNKLLFVSNLENFYCK